MLIDFFVNAPGARAFFPEDTEGALIQVVGDTIRCRPTREKAGDGYALGLPMPRGGYRFAVKADDQPALLRLLEQIGARRRPYFRLRQAGDGWIELAHHDDEREPSRTELYVRVMPPAVRDEDERPPLLQNHPALGHADLVRHAASVVAQWHSSRRVGRRPREVEDAHKVLESFTELVREVRPALLLEGLIDLNAVRAARDALTHVLDEVEGDGVQR